jgi:hypothetical protein
MYSHHGTQIPSSSFILVCMSHQDPHACKRTQHAPTNHMMTHVHDASTQSHTHSSRKASMCEPMYAHTQRLGWTKTTVGDVVLLFEGALSSGETKAKATTYNNKTPRRQKRTPSDFSNAATSSINAHRHSTNPAYFTSHRMLQVSNIVNKTDFLASRG